jgi:signal transduction histidine kinase
MSNAKTRSLHWWISVALIGFGVLTAVALTIQQYRSQELVEHRIWRQILESAALTYVEQRAVDPNAPLPRVGILQSWLVHEREPTAGMPAFLAPLAPGYYSSEGGNSISMDDTGYTFHALVTPFGSARLVTFLDIDEFETQQNQDSMWTALGLMMFVAFVAVMIGWLHNNLVRPVEHLANCMQAIDPAIKGQRLPTDHAPAEIQIIARASNAHLERVEQFIERERSLLDQASHEFRTPLSVIAGAVDVLRMQELPVSARPALERIHSTVNSFSDIMVALLYLARETSSTDRPQEITALHTLLPKLISDHEHLLAGKPVRFHMKQLAPTIVDASEAMVRMAVGNLMRNAVENTAAGCIEVSLQDGVVAIADSGSGFDPLEVARRYRESLRAAAPIRGQGLGLFLISRICDRFGWQFSIENLPLSGTRARLDMSASLLVDSDAP